MAQVVLADVDERILFGELGQRGPERALLVRPNGEHDGLERRAREPRRDVHARRRLPDGIADAHRAEPADRGHLARHDVVAPRRAGRGEHADRRRLRLVPSPDPNALARPERAREQPSVGNALARGGPLDLEDAARHVAVRVGPRAGEELVDTGQQRVDPDALSRRAEEHRMDEALPGLCGELLAEARVRERGLIPDERPQDGLVVLGEALGQRAAMGLVRRREGHERRLAPAGVAGESHRDHARRQPPRHHLDHPIRVGAGPVDLVDEDQGRDVEPAKGAEEERRLGLDTLDRRHDEDRAVEHAEDAFDLGDEVRVTGRVDEVDGEIAHEERGDGGSNGDAAFALEVERVGLGGAGVDAADILDGAGGEEEPLGEGGLTGVDVGENAEIERAHGTSCRARRCGPSAWTRVSSCRSFLMRWHGLCVTSVARRVNVLPAIAAVTRTRPGGSS